MRFKGASLLLVLGLISLLLAACGDSTNTPGTAVTSAATSSTTSKATTTGAASTTAVSDSQALKAAQDLGTNLTAASDALKKNDLEAARAAYKKFDDGWFNVETSIQSRSKDAYKAIEEAITKAGRELIRNDKPVVADIIPLVADLQQKYDAGVKLIQTSPVAAGAALPAAITGADVDAATQKVDQYLKTETDKFVKNTNAFVSAVKAHDLAQAKTAYLPARTGYEGIEFMASAFKSLDSAVDARADDFPNGEKDTNWTGFHVLEKAIWVDGKLDSTTDKLADQLLTDVTALSTQINTLKVDPSVAIAGALDLIEEIQATKITGEEERYSHTDLNDFKANLMSAKTLYDAYSPFVKQRNPVLDDELQTRFKDVQTSIAGYFDAQGNLNTDYTKVDDATRKTLAQKVEGLADSFSRVGGTLGIKG